MVDSPVALILSELEAAMLVIVSIELSLDIEIDPLRAPSSRSRMIGDPVVDESDTILVGRLTLELMMLLLRVLPLPSSRNFSKVLFSGSPLSFGLLRLPFLLIPSDSNVTIGSPRALIFLSHSGVS